MVIDGLDTLSQVALAQADHLGILDNYQQCSSMDDDQDLFMIDEDMLATPDALHSATSSCGGLSTNFLFGNDLMEDNHRQPTQIGECVPGV